MTITEQRVKDILEPHGYTVTAGKCEFLDRPVAVITHPDSNKQHVLEVVSILYAATGEDPEFYRAADGSVHVLVSNPWAREMPSGKLFSIWRPPASETDDLEQATLI